MEFGSYDSPLTVRKNTRPGKIYRRPVQFMHADKDGSPVLVEESSWRTINGVIFRNVFGHRVFVLFRRWRQRS